MAIARRFIISGDVQGVGFRYFARRSAESWGVAGTVKNLADGSVEVVAEGPPEAVESFRADLERGPRSGRVAHLVEEPMPVAGYDSFRIIF